MNIYKLITPVNRYNYVNHPYLKLDLDYYSQHYDTVENNDEFAFMKRKKLSTTIHGKAYNDDYLIPKINVISNAMKVDIQDRTPLSKRMPDVMQNPYIPFGDPNTKYDELLAASQQMLASVEPINYFGCRIVNDYLYNFDIGMIFKIIPKDFLAKFIDPTLIKESTVYVDSRSAMIMPQKSAFKNIWMDTKRYIPVNPKYVETIDINSLIEPVSTVQQPVSTVQQPVSTVQQPVGQPAREPIITEQPIEQTPVSRNIPIGEIPPLPFDQTLIELPYGSVNTVPYGSVNTVPVVESDNTVLEQQEQRKRKILDESLNEQQQQPTRRRRKPKMNETK